MVESAFVIEPCGKSRRRTKSQSRRIDTKNVSRQFTSIAQVINSVAVIVNKSFAGVESSRTILVVIRLAGGVAAVVVGVEIIFAGVINACRAAGNVGECINRRARFAAANHSDINFAAIICNCKRAHISRRAISVGGRQTCCWDNLAGKCAACQIAPIERAIFQIHHKQRAVVIGNRHSAERSFTYTVPTRIAVVSLIIRRIVRVERDARHGKSACYRTFIAVAGAVNYINRARIVRCVKRVVRARAKTGMAFEKCSGV